MLHKPEPSRACGGPRGFWWPGDKGSWSVGEKDRGPDPQRLGLKVARCPAACPFSNWCTRVRIQEPGHTIKELRFPRGQRRGQGFGRRTLPGSLFPSPAGGAGPAAAAGPEGGQDRGPDPGAPHVRRSLTSANYRLAAWSLIDNAYLAQFCPWALSCLYGGVFFLRQRRK